MKYKYTLIVVVVVGIHTWLYVIPLSAGEGNRFGCFETRKQTFGKELFTELKLTEEQRKTVKENRLALAAQQKALKAKIREKRLALKTELEEEKSDPAKIDAMVDDLTGLLGQRIENRVQGILAIKEVLTPEQFRMFQEKAQGFKKQRWMRNKRYFQ